MGLHETTMTELLNSFFNEEPLYLRKAIINYILEKCQSNMKFEDFHGISDQGKYTCRTSLKRPDLVFEGIDSLVFIEVKINNDPLEPSQCCTDVNDSDCYLGMLKQSGKKNTDLLFLVPSNYAHLTDIPVPKEKILFWSDIDLFVQSNEYDNQVIKKILFLSSDYTTNYKKEVASKIDMQHLAYDIDYLPRIERIHNRLRKIIDESNYEDYFQENTIPTAYRWDPNEENPYTTKNCLVEGLYIGEKVLGLCIIPTSPYLYLDTTEPLKNKEDLADKLKLGTHLYKLCELTEEMQTCIDRINALLS